MKPTATHPSPERLRAFALGQLAADEFGPLEAHVAGCDACAAALAAVPDDTLLGKLRDTPTVGVIADTLDGLGDEVPAELTDHPRYAIVRRLGAGGMGTVYQARHKIMERDVALKVIAPRLTRHPVAVQRFAQEVKAAARLTHPNIVAAHDADQAGGLHFLVMEYVEGVSLDRLVAKRGRVPIDQAVHFIRQAALGLQHAHEQGMVHRDVKPQNLMVTRKGQVKILDFGLARVAEAAARPAEGARPLTSLGTILGTPDYIAPEQVSDSHHVDTRADIYSLGCTLHFLLAGRPPFPEGSAIEKAMAHAQLLPAPIRTLRPEVPPELAAVLERMMAKKPDDRYQTPGEVAAALAAVQRPKPADTAVKAKPPRRAVLWVAAAAMMAVAAAAGLYALVPKKPRVLLVLPHQKFWYPDYQGVRDGLEGKAVLIVASSDRTPAEANDGQRVTPDLTLAEARPEDYDAVIFSGGLNMEFAHRWPHQEVARTFIGRMLARDRPVGGLCGGTMVLAKAGVLRGKRATGFPPLREQLEKFGELRYVDEPVVVEGRLITGRDAAAGRAFAERLLAEMKR